MVVPTSVFHEVGHFQGFNGDVDKYLSVLLSDENTKFKPRAAMEEDPSFKQLIPYCIFMHQGKIFQYSRGAKGDEARLHAKRSIGVGGHISLDDAEADGDTYEAAMQREINEEVMIGSEYTTKCVGLINDDENEVGKVHLGVVHIFELQFPEVAAREKALEDARFEDPEVMFQEIDQFEPWSQICLRGLFKDEI